MGSLSNFNDTCVSINEIKTKYDLNVFVETGCFQGNTLRYMTGYNFERMYSCDIDKEMIDRCSNISPNLELFLGTSVEFLKQLLPTLTADRILFFLDAHLPEHDKNSGTVILESEHNFPLREELEIINKYRKDKNDVIVCDDLRIYEDGPFEGGNWDKRKNYKDLDLSFLSIYNYKVEKFYNHEGYIFLTKDIAV